MDASGAGPDAVGGPPPLGAPPAPGATPASAGLLPRTAGATPGARRRGPLARFWLGVATLFRGFSLWGSRPGVMLLGLLPAVLVFVVLAAAITLLALNAGAIAAAVTPFAVDWTPVLRELVRATVAVVIVLAAGVVAVLAYTGLTLAVGEPFYDRVWRAAEQQLGGAPADDGIGFWRALGDAIKLIALGILTAILVAVVGLIPVVGTPLGWTLGVVLSGRLLAGELLTRPFEARGIDAAGRRRVLRGHAAEQLGFGIATQLCFLVPLGAVLVMPAAVVGATRLARGMLVDAERASLDR